uniref:Uncharacterized protein n=1 Tax=Sphaerodactylus townsendi TaxID=933632 RepID=A0ACB8FFB2_9SAUR
MLSSLPDAFINETCAARDSSSRITIPVDFLSRRSFSPLTAPGLSAPPLWNQDALLSLGSVLDVSSLREVIKDAIASVLPKVFHLCG